MASTGVTNARGPLPQPTAASRFPTFSLTTATGSNQAQSKEFNPTSSNVNLSMESKQNLVKFLAQECWCLGKVNHNFSQNHEVNVDLRAVVVVNWSTCSPYTLAVRV